MEDKKHPNLCRICLGKDAKLPIFEFIDEDQSILSKLTMCLNQKINDEEGYPRYICKLCNDDLETVCNFINKFKNTSKILENGLFCMKEENDTYCDYSDNDHSEVEIDIQNIKSEPVECDKVVNHHIEFLTPLHVKIKTKLKKETTPESKLKRSTMKHKTNNTTNKIASSLLEGEFVWNGNEWCLKSNVSTWKEHKKEVIKCKKKRLPPIKVPKIKQPNPPKLCDLCGEVFKDQDKLSVHKKKVHFKEPVKCPHCPRTLVSLYYLRRHVKRKHNESKDFICSVCGRGFAFRGELSSHHKVVHEGIKPRKEYKCKFCNKNYKCAKSVVVHERSAHTGQRPAVCTVCDASFYHEDYLKEHMRLHTGETPFKCPVCGRGYAQRCNMKSHLRIHRISELDATTLNKMRPSYLKLLKA